MAKYLFGSVAKHFRQKITSRRKRKAKLKAERQKQFRKGFVHKRSIPKQFDVKPDLPTRGKRKRRLFF